MLMNIRAKSPYFTSLLTLAACLFSMKAAWAIEFSSRLDRAQWQVEGDVFTCRLTQAIENFGTAVFFREAGEKQTFRLEAKSIRMAKGKASLVVKSPEWRPYEPSRGLGLVSVEESKEPIALEHNQASQLLDELLKGKVPTFERRAFYTPRNPLEPVKVAVSPVSFQEAYDNYQDCVATLLPANFKQLHRTATYYSKEEWDLPAGQEEKLDHIAQYVIADKRVKQIYIDAHTDYEGLRADNLDISKNRAEQVTDFLVEQGVPRDMIVVRWHGERYPIATNRTEAGRAKNRRVTVRMERADPEPKR